MKKLNLLILSAVIAAGLFSQSPGPKTILKENQVKITVVSVVKEELEPLAFTPPGSISALQFAPANNTVPKLYRNGVLQKPGQDFNWNGRIPVPTFPGDWAADDTILVDYKH